MDVVRRDVKIITDPISHLRRDAETFYNIVLAQVKETQLGMDILYKAIESGALPPLNNALVENFVRQITQCYDDILAQRSPPSDNTLQMMAYVSAVSQISLRMLAAFSPLMVLGQYDITVNTFVNESVLAKQGTADLINANTAAMAHFTRASPPAAPLPLPHQAPSTPLSSTGPSLEIEFAPPRQAARQTLASVAAGLSATLERFEDVIPSGRKMMLDGTCRIVIMRGPAGQYFIGFGEMHYNAEGLGYCDRSSVAQRLTVVKMETLLRRHLLGSAEKVDLFLEAEYIPAQREDNKEYYALVTQANYHIPMQTLRRAFPTCKPGDEEQCKYPTLHTHASNVRNIPAMQVLYRLLPDMTARELLEIIHSFVSESQSLLTTSGYDYFQLVDMYSEAGRVNVANALAQTWLHDSKTRILKQISKLNNLRDNVSTLLAAQLTRITNRTFDNMKRRVVDALAIYRDRLTGTPISATTTDLYKIVNELKYVVSSLQDLYTLARGLYAQRQRQSLFVYEAGDYHIGLTIGILRDDFGFIVLYNEYSPIRDNCVDIAMDSVMATAALPIMSQVVFSRSDNFDKPARDWLLLVLVRCYDKAMNASNIEALQASITDRAPASIFDIVKYPPTAQDTYKKVFLMRSGNDLIALLVRQNAITLYMGFFGERYSALLSAAPAGFNDELAALTVKESDANLSIDLAESRKTGGLVLTSTRIPVETPKRLHDWDISCLAQLRLIDWNDVVGEHM